MLFSPVIRFVFMLGALLPSLAFAASSDAPQGLVQAFGNWTVTCDQALFCTAMGFPDEGSETGGALVIEQDAGRYGDFAARIIFPDAAAFDIGMNVSPEISLNTAGAKTLLASVKSGRSGNKVMLRFPTIAHVELLQALISAQVLSASIGSWKTVGPLTIDLGGLFESLRFIDEVQGRSGTPWALLDSGNRQTMPDVALGRGGISTYYETPEPMAFDLEAIKADWQAVCSDWQNTDMTGAAAYQLNEYVQIWQMPCGAGDDNPGSLFFYHIDNRFTRIQFTDIPFALEQSDEAEEEPVEGLYDAVLPNAIVHFENGFFEVESLQKTRPQGDCGEKRRYVLTIDTFILAQRGRMSQCAGLAPQDWPLLHNSEYTVQ